MEAIRRWTRPARGQAQVEYTLILALIAIVASLALLALGEQIPGVFAQVDSALGGQEECRGNQCGKPGNPDPGPPDAPKPGNPNPGDPNAPKPGNPNPGQPNMSYSSVTFGDIASPTPLVTRATSKDRFPQVTPCVSPHPA